MRRRVWRGAFRARTGFLPFARGALLWLATWLLVAQSIIPTHLSAAPIDPIARIALASLCQSEADKASAPSDDGGSTAHTGPQCIFCTPGHNLVTPQSVALQLPHFTWRIVSAPLRTGAAVSDRPYERPAVRGPPVTA